MCDERKRELFAPKTGIFEFGSLSYERLLHSEILTLLKEKGEDFFLSEESDFKKEVSELGV